MDQRQPHTLERRRSDLEKALDALIQTHLTPPSPPVYQAPPPPPPQVVYSKRPAEPPTEVDCFALGLMLGMALLALAIVLVKHQ